MTFIMNVIMGFVMRWLPPLRAALTNPRVIIIALAAAFAFSVTLEETRIAAARRRAVVAALAISNLAAQRDSTRDVALTNDRVVRMLGDSLKLVEIRVVQSAQRRDALDNALGRERVARYGDTVATDSLRAVMYAMTLAVRMSNSSDIANSGQTVRSAFFNIRQEPYTVAAQVDIPPPPDSAHLELHVAIDPIPIETRVGCSKPDAQGIKAATVSASSPTWATVQFGRVEQSPEVCGSPGLQGAVRQARRWITKGLVIGAGRALTPNGWHWAVFAGAGIGLGL
jgi:hypothetical protein